MLPTRTTRLLVCVVVAAVTVGLDGCGGARARFTSHLRRGQEFLSAGNLDKASVEFRNAAQIEPKNAQALYFNGRVAEARGNIREAYGYYQAAVDADPNDLRALASTGKMLVFAGAPKRAMDVIGPGLSAHPDDADLLAVRAAAHQQLEEKDEARADAERAVQLAPANENALTILAAIYAGAKEYPRAISLLSSAIERSPASVELRAVMTNLYLVSGQPAEAEKQMRKIIELKPLDLASRSQLAAHLARNHDVDGAQRVLEDAVRAFSDRKQQSKGDEAKLLLAEFISQDRSREQGEKTLREFIAREPDNLDLRMGLGALLQRTGAASEALTAYQTVVDRDGTGAKGLAARDRMAAIRVQQGNTDLAGKLLAEVLQKNPRDDDALLLRASLEMQRHDPDGAIADLRAVVRDQPNSAGLQRDLASAYLAKGETALAQEALQTALLIAPNDLDVRIQLAELFVRGDRAPQGLALLEETVKRLPDNAPAREALIRAYMATGHLLNARDAAEDLKTRQPKSAAGFYYAGLVAAQQKHLEESQTNFETVLELQPQRLDALRSLVRVMQMRGASEAAVGRVQKALAQEPDNAELLNLLGELYFERKDFAHAGDAFARAIARNPGLWQGHWNLARVKLAVNEADGALGEYQSALKLAPGEPQLVGDAAQLYEKQGRIDDAIAGYQALYDNNPRARQFGANNLAMLLVTYKKDQASLDRALALTKELATSDNGTLLDTVGWVRFKRGEYHEALPALERASERAPDSKVIRFHLAMTQLQLGLRDRARANLESALNGSDSFQGADEARTALASLKVRA